MPPSSSVDRLASPLASLGPPIVPPRASPPGGAPFADALSSIARPMSFICDSQASWADFGRPSPAERALSIALRLRLAASRRCRCSAVTAGDTGSNSERSAGSSARFFHLRGCR